MDIKMRISKKRNVVIVAAVLLIINAVYYILARDLDSKHISGERFGETFLPYILCVGLLLSVFIYIYEAFFKDKDSTGDEALRSNRALFVIISVFTIYLLILPRLGFKLSTPLFLSVLIRITGARHPLWMILVISIVITMVAYFVFETGFKVFLPYGIF